MKAAIVIALSLLCGSCGGSATPKQQTSPPPPPVQGATLAGSWRISTPGVTVHLALQDTGAGAFTGSGSYTATSTSSVARCGGTTLHAAGTLSATAQFQNPAATISLVFDVGWGPPVTAVLSTTAHGDGQFMGVDTQCAMTMDRE